MINLPLMEKNIYYLKGCKELEFKNYKTAINYFSKAIAEDPNDLESLIKRAYTYLEIEDHDNFRHDLFLQSKLYTKQKKENPNNHEIFYKRAEIYSLLNREIQAIADYEKAIKLKPEFVDAYIGLGLVKKYQGLDGVNPALNIFFQAISLQPDNSQALYEIASIYARKDNLEKAIEYYKKCIETKGDCSPVSYRSLGSLYSKMNRYEDAIALYKDFLSHSGSDNDYSRLAYFYEKMGALSEAIIHMYTAISININSPHNYFQLSKLYVKSANYEMALENINEAISLSCCRSYLQHKAKLLLKLGKTEEAEKIFDEIWMGCASAYNKLKKLAIIRGIDFNEINQLTQNSW